MGGIKESLLMALDLLNLNVRPFSTYTIRTQGWLVSMVLIPEIRIRRWAGVTNEERPPGACVEAQVTRANITSCLQ